MRLNYKFTLLPLLLLWGSTIHAENVDIDVLTALALEGNAKAQFQLGSMYDFGHGVKRSREEAEKWYLMAAKNGYAEAQNSLGSGYQAEKRYEEARKWYEKAATRGHALATNNLALLHDLGLGVPQDRQKGFDLYTRAANLGWPEAMWNIANMYGAGQLGKTDLYKACVWTFRAKHYTDDSQVRLNENIERILPYLKNTLSHKQYSACEHEANNWVPSK